MPEQITKHPDVTLQVLKGAGGRCGEGVEKKILTKCPSERFCSFPSGEICVYGIPQINQMTQITTKELAAVVCPLDKRSSLDFGVFPTPDILGVAGGVFLAGLVVAGIWTKVQKS
jgi:hypothetical protein